MAKIIGFANQQGGVGTTTSAFAFAADLALHGFRVLLVDCDPLSTLTVNCSYTQDWHRDVIESASIAKRLQLMLDHDSMPTDFVLHYQFKDGFPRVSHGCLNIIPSCISLASVQYLIPNNPEGKLVLTKILKPFRDLYNYIIIDCQSNLNLWSISVLAACDDIIIPVQTQPAAIQGAMALLDTVRDVKRYVKPSLSVRGLLLTMTDKRTSVYKDCRRLIHFMYGGIIPIFASEIPYSIAAAYASQMHRTVFEMDDSSSISVAYHQFTEEYLS